MIRQLNDFEIENPNSPENLLARKIIEQLNRENDLTLERAYQLINEEVEKQGKKDDVDFFYNVRTKVVNEILFGTDGEKKAESNTTPPSNPLTGFDAFGRWQDKNDK